MGCDTADAADEIASSIAVVVEGLAELARFFDSGPANSSYAVNVMMFLEPNVGAAWFPHVAFLEQGVALENLRGLLALHTPFSALKNGSAPAVSPDPTMQPFALPIPVDPGGPKDSGGDGWRVLPGGPRAFVYGSFEHFSPATELATWCEKDGDFNHYVISKISKYFRNSPHIGGFCTMALFEPTEKFETPENRRTIGVLNVHWSSARLLEQPHAAASFADAIFPIRALLARQLLRLFQKTGSKPSPTSMAPGEAQS